MDSTLPSPIPGHWSVRDARDAYLAENGWTLEAYDAKYTEASFFGIGFKVPNTPAHALGIRLHDLHHVAAGYGTDMMGEGEISLWEVRNGLKGLGLYVGAIVALGALGGLVLSPRRALRAFRVGKLGRPLFGTKRPYEELLTLDVAALRQELGIAPEGLVQGAQKLHAKAPRAALPASTSPPLV